MRISDWSSDVCSSDLYLGESLKDLQARKQCPLGIILVGGRITEIRHDCVTNVACKLPSMPSHNGTACVQEPFSQPADALRNGPDRKFRRSHAVPQKYCQSPSLCRGGYLVLRVSPSISPTTPFPRST